MSILCGGEVSSVRQMRLRVCISKGDDHNDLCKVIAWVFSMQIKFIAVCMVQTRVGKGDRRVPMSLYHFAMRFQTEVDLVDEGWRSDIRSNRLISRKADM